MILSAQAKYAVGFVDGLANVTLFGPFETLELSDEFVTPPGLDGHDRVSYTLLEPVVWTDEDGNR